METTYGVHWSTNTKGHLYEDRYVLALGDFPDRLARAKSDAEETRWENRIAERCARGLLFAVMDGVGSALRGREAAEVTASTLRSFYTRVPQLPPTYGSILELLQEANTRVHGWGTVGERDGAEALGADRSQGAAAVTAAFFSPQRNVTVLHTGDTAALFYRPGATGLIKKLTTDDTAGAGISGYVGLGPAFKPKVVPVDGLVPGDFIVLVTDGVVPKGMQQDGVLRTLEENVDDPEAAARELGTRARARGSVDDITAIVIRLDSWE